MLVDICRLSSNVRRLAPRQGHLSAGESRPFPSSGPVPSRLFLVFPLPLLFLVSRRPLGLPWTYPRPRVHRRPRAPPRRTTGPCRGRWTACGALPFPPAYPGPGRSIYPAPISLPCTNRPTLHKAAYPAPVRMPRASPSGPRKPSAQPGPLARGKAPGKRSPGGPAPLNNDLHFTYPVPGRGPPSRLLACPPGDRLPSPRLARFRGHFRLSAKFGPPAQDDRPTLQPHPAYPAPPTGRARRRETVDGQARQTDRQTRQPVRFRAHHSSTYPAPAARGNDK